MYRRNRWTPSAALMSGWLSVLAAASGQTLPYPTSPGVPRLDIPPGVAIERPVNDAVVTIAHHGEKVVGRCLVRAGTFSLVHLPDGRIIRHDGVVAAEGNRRFRPISARELGAQFRDRFPAMQVRVSGGYVLVSNTTPLFTEVTRRILTTMAPGIRKYMRGQGLKVHNPEFPLVVMMFRTRSEFDRYQRMPPEVLAYYDPWTNYIVLHEESPLYRVDRDLAVRETIATIAHEGVHQILHNIGVQQRLSQWPMWISEGLAEYFAPTTVGRRMSWKGAGEVNDMRMLELEHYVKAKAFDAEPGEMIEHTTGAARLTSTGYATAWALTHFLATEEKTKFDDLLRELSSLGPFEKIGTANQEGLVREQVAQFTRHFGADLPKLEQQLIAHLEKLPYRDPFAAAPHYLALITLQRGKDSGWKANIFHTEQQAKQWTTQYLDTLDPAIVPQVQIMRLPNRAAAELYIKRFAATRK